MIEKLSIKCNTLHLTFVIEFDGKILWGAICNFFRVLDTWTELTQVLEVLLKPYVTYVH